MELHNENGKVARVEMNDNSELYNRSSKTIDLQLAVVGGGIVGIITALGLLSRGFSVKIYEQSRSLREIGAGVAFSANAQLCMELLDPSILQAMKVVSTKSPSGRYAYVDGYHPQSDDRNDMNEKELFRFHAGDMGFEGCHRAHLLDQLAKLIPEGVVEYRKRLDTCDTRESDGLIVMKFEDGTTATADAVIGCDGVRSRVRRILLGDNNPASYPSYSHKVAYRGLVKMDKAEAAIGWERSHNLCVHMGPKAHIIHFPIAQHTLMNVVAFATDEGEWPHEKMTAPATTEELMNIFKDWTPAVRTIVSLLENLLDKWAIFDTCDHPMPYYSRNRICVAGDAAHASGPHHGAGAGVGVEDALALATVMEEVRSTLQKDKEPSSHRKNAALAVAFQAFDASRRERTQWLVQSTRHICDVYEWMDQDCGSDPDKCLKEIEWRTHKIWHFDIEGMRSDARAHYARLMCV